MLPSFFVVRDMQKNLTSRTGGSLDFRGKRRSSEQAPKSGFFFFEGQVSECRNRL
ncbi:hypothetical protein SAMN05518855_102525 [Paenibacillus sp. CF384]|nr:hypothetical protein SAMN05518855_102525 [Paenibacillus sp. CF384]